MTTYYKGNNIGLNYDAANATWSFSNEPQDFIDTSSFSTTDPDFPTAPVDDTPPEEDTPTCPPGYVYDETLQQCVPDPQYQAPAFAGAPEMQPGGQREPVLIPGTNRYTTDNNFIATDEEYAAMTADQLLENFRARGIITKDKISGNTIVDLGRFDNIGAKGIDLFHKRFGQTSDIARNKKDRVISLLIDKKLVNQMDIYPQGGITATGDFGSIPNQIIIPGTATTPQDVKAPPTDIFNIWGNYVTSTKNVITKKKDTIVPLRTPIKSGGDSGEFGNIPINKEEQIIDEKLNQEKQKTLREEIKTNQAKQDMQQTIKQAEKSYSQDRATGKFSGSPSAKTDKPAASKGAYTGPKKYGR